MKNKTKKYFAIFLTIAVISCALSACNGNRDNNSNTGTLNDVDGNPYTTHEIIDGEPYISYDYDDVYDSLDLSQYDSYGSFGEDGLMWVEKSDYTGKQYGYIDYKGNIVIPFTSEIVEPGDFKHGYAIVSYEQDVMRNGIYAVINTKGEAIFEFENHGASLHYQSANGNIVLIDINLIDDSYSSPKDYILCSKTGKVVEIVEESCSFYTPRSMYYSDGLLRTYRTDWDVPNNNNDVGYIEVVTFYDENGEFALRIDTNSSEYYKSLMYVDDFINGKADVYFWGLDSNYYKVQIDKNGEWVNDPVQISKEEIKNF